MGRIVTFRVYAGIGTVDPLPDSISVRGSFNSWGEAPLLSLAGDGVFSGNVFIEGLAGSSVSFKYVARVGGAEVWEGGSNFANRTYILGPDDVSAFASADPHIFGTLNPIAPKGVRTGEAVLFLPISQAAAGSPWHGWFFENNVTWDGNSPLIETGVVFSSSPIAIERGPQDALVSPSSVKTTQSLSVALGEFSASSPKSNAGRSGAGNFSSGAIYYRAYAKNQVGACYGDQRQSIVPSGNLREWRNSFFAGDVFGGEDSTNLRKRVTLTWAEQQGAQGNWKWEIYRLESSQIDQNPMFKHRLLGSFSDAELDRIGDRRKFTDGGVIPGFSYLYLIGVRDEVGLMGFRSAWLNVSAWLTPAKPSASAESQTPHSVTFNIS